MAGGMCGSVWQECVVGMCGRGACMAGGMHGRGACMTGGHAQPGDMRGKGARVARGVCMAKGCAWQEGMHGGGVVCMARGHAWPGLCPPRQILRHRINERVVRILLECILFKY